MYFGHAWIMVTGGLCLSNDFKQFMKAFNSELIEIVSFRFGKCRQSKYLSVCNLSFFTFAIHVEVKCTVIVRWNQGKSSENEISMIYNLKSVLLLITIFIPSFLFNGKIL